MFDCHKCLIRCLRAVAGDLKIQPCTTAFQAVRRPRAAQLSLFTARQSARGYAAVAMYRPRQGGSHSEVVIRPSRQRSEIGSRDTNVEKATINPMHIAQELRHIGSPMQLADHVRNVLRRGQYTKAYELLKGASKDMPCVVGWNHLLDFHLSQGKIKTTLKLYNDMKKRAQRPDSYTYLLLLRGFALNASHKHVVSEAVKLYHSMKAPNSRVQPRIIHTNAVLNVAAQAGDMDALWGMAAEIPQDGADAADYTTYSTVLKALKLQASTPKLEGVSDAQHEKAVSDILADGRRIWIEVVDRWRRGLLFIDESLVCSMGRLLLQGPRRRDWDDVFSLVEQTMKIPRLTSRFGTAYDPPSLDVSNTCSTNSSPASPDTSIESGTSVSAPEPEGNGNVSVDEFGPVELPTEPTTQEGKASTYVFPSNNTLSMILEACAMLEIKRVARQYWDLLTTDLRFKVVPDADNFHILLRHLRRSRSSAEALEIMRTQMSTVPLARKTFRIAMSTCVRDKNNVNIMTTANAMVDMMYNRLPYADLQTLARYLEIALRATDPRHVINALDRVSLHSLELRKLLRPDPDDAGQAGSSSQRIEVVEAAAQLCRAAVACCDRLLYRNEIPEDRREFYQQHRNKLTSFASQLEQVKRMSRKIDITANSTEKSTSSSLPIGSQFVVMKGGKRISRVEVVQKLRAEKRRVRREKEKEARSNRERSARDMPKQQEEAETIPE